MNLFDMIFRNSKSKEVVFSSVYNYLLDRFETHGLGSLMLERVIDALPNDQARSLLSGTGFEAQSTEAEFSLAEVGQIDSMIEISTKDGPKSVYLFTEIKIIDSSARNVTRHGGQVKRYLEYIRANITEDFVFLYLVPDSRSVTALREFASVIKDSDADMAEKCFVMYWRDGEASDSIVPETNVCRDSFETIVRDVLKDELAGSIPPISTEMRYVLRSLINTVHNNFNREQIPFDQGRFPDRGEFLERLPEVHRDLFEYLEEKSGGRRTINRNNTSIGFPYTDNPGGNPNSLFRVLTMKKYQRSAAEIVDTDYADQLIIEFNENIWSLDDALKDELAALFKGSSHVAFHRYHPNGKKNEKATWIMFDEGIKAGALPEVKEQIDRFWDLAEERFKAFLESMR